MVKTCETPPGLGPTLHTIALDDRPHSRLAPVGFPALPPRPLVSVLITSYNYASYIGAAIESVLNQTYQTVEVIVCDDASTDDSYTVIEQYVHHDSRVQLIRHSQNGGKAIATNDAFAASSGNIICFLDADDYFDPQKIERVVNEFLAHSSTGLVIHAMNVIDQSGRHIQRNPNMTKFEHGWIADRVIQRGGRWRDMPSSAMGFRRELAEFIFPIPEKTFRRGGQDGFIFTLLPLLTEVSAIDEPLSSYRVHGQNTFATQRVSLTHAIGQVNRVTKQVYAVNHRLKEFGFPEEILDIRRNLGYQQSKFLLALLQRTPRPRLIRAYASLLTALFADDLYRSPQKLFGLIVYGGAIALPAAFRPWWLSTALAPSTAKLRLQQVRKGVRQMLRSRKPRLAWQSNDASTML